MMDRPVACTKRLSALLLAVSCGLACSTRESTGVDRGPAVPPPASPRGEIGPVSRVEAAATAHMGSHFADLLEVHVSLIRGDVPAARAAAQSLADEHPTVMLESWAPQLLATRNAAEAVARSATLEQAAVHAAELAASCGDCHAMLGARLRMPSQPAPPEDPDPAATMRRHKWAFDRLWEGLVVPSEKAWLRGVNAFVELPACHDDLSGEQDAAAIARVRGVVRDLQAQAIDTRSLPQRAKVYGALLPTCATCHAGGC